MSNTVIVTDGKYRSSIAAIRSLGMCGYEIIVTQTKEEASYKPASFYSKYVKKYHIIDGSFNDSDYIEKLIDIIKQYDNPVLLCIGANTLNAVSKNVEQVSKYASFIIDNPECLDGLNDKETVAEHARKLNIPTPIEYSNIPTKFPVIIKPHCGEKFGLHAEERYYIANNIMEFNKYYDIVKKYDESPIVQEKIQGEGRGASLLIDNNGNLISAICHQRVREYPITGGPSSCCKSVFDEDLINKAYSLLSSFSFHGIAMVEFKGDCLLEVNPRIWGSFPLTYICKSDFIEKYVLSANGKKCTFNPDGYIRNRKMKFLLNDLLASFSYLKNKKYEKFFSGIKDFFSVRDAIASFSDPLPFFVYLKTAISKKD